NTRVQAIHVDAPDLIVTKAAAPTTAVVGETINVSYTVQNRGQFTASADWSDRFYLSGDAVFDAGDRLLGSRFISTQTPLAAGGTYTVTNATVDTSSATPG